MSSLRRRALVVLVALLGAARSPIARADDTGVAVVGLLPPYDASGEGHGGVVAQALASYLFNRLSSASLRVVLLNPGPGYAPHDEGSFLDLARDQGVGHVVVATVEPSDRPQKAKVRLHATATVLDVGSRRSLVKAAADTELKRDDVQRYREFEGLALFSHSQQFENGPLGKATRRLADTLAEGLSDVWDTLPRLALRQPEGGPACRTRFRIRYPGDAVSKTYSLEVNGRDETLAVRDGVTPLALPSGPVVIFALVKDAPHRVPVQVAYFANALLDCASNPGELVLEISPVGEGRLTWR